MAEGEFHALTVARVVAETEHAVRVRFHVPDPLQETFRFHQGQYLTLQANIGGQLLRRSYSICSSVHDPDLEIAIKHIAGGVFSSYANGELKAGDVLDVMAPRGSFFVPLDPTSARHYLFIASGSGITPVISNISSILQAETHSRVTLLFGNQQTSTIMFRERLSFLKNRYLQRLHWVNILSREDQGAEVLNGRLDNRKGAQLNERLIDLDSFDEYFICGPESMISEVSRGLRAFGISEAHIHYELFAASAEDARAVVARHQARAIAYSDKVSEVTVVADGRSLTLALPSDGENILDAGLRAGLDLPYSCKGGVCSTCKAKLVSGEVDMDLTHGLEPAEQAAGYILACQSHPISDRVVVDFDQR